MAFHGLNLKRRAVIFCVFLASLSILLGCFLWQKKGESSVFVAYTAVFEVDAAVADSFSLGDVLTDARGKEAAGAILKIGKAPALREDAHGVYALPDRVSLCLTLGDYGRMGAGGARIGTLTPKRGEAVYLYGVAKLEGLCVRVRVL